MCVLERVTSEPHGRQSGHRRTTDDELESELAQLQRPNTLNVYLGAYYQLPNQSSATFFNKSNLQFCPALDLRLGIDIAVLKY